MSILPLLETLRSESKIVLNTNAAFIHVNIITQAGHQIVFDYVGIIEIKNIKRRSFNMCSLLLHMCFSNRISMWSCNLWLLICTSF